MGGAGRVSHAARTLVLDDHRIGGGCGVGGAGGAFAGRTACHGACDPAFAIEPAAAGYQKPRRHHHSRKAGGADGAGLPSNTQPQGADSRQRRHRRSSGASGGRSNGGAAGSSGRSSSRDAIVPRSASSPARRAPPLGLPEYDRYDVDPLSRSARAGLTDAEFDGSPFRSPRLRAAEFNRRSDTEYLNLSQSEIERIWQREKLKGALTPRLALEDAAAGSGAEVNGAEGAGPPVELALTATVSLANTKTGRVVRRVLV